MFDIIRKIIVTQAIVITGHGVTVLGLYIPQKYVGTLGGSTDVQCHTGYLYEQNLATDRLYFALCDPKLSAL